MEKISAQKVVRILGDAAVALDKAASIIAAQQQELGQYRRKEDATKIASAMREKNLAPTWAPTEEAAVQHILQLPMDKMAALRMSVDMATPQDPFARLDKDPETSHSSSSVPGTSSFERFVLGDE